MTTPYDRFLAEADWLENNLSAPNLRIVDCRLRFDMDAERDIHFYSARNEWLKAHVPRATYVNIESELSRPDSDLPFMLPGTDHFAEAVSRLGIEDGTTVILYDDFYNIWAARMWWMLRAFGFCEARVLNGGLTKWKMEGRPLASGEEPAERSNFVARPNRDIFIGKNDVLAATKDPATLIVDALPPDQYSGENPSWVERPGHIPTSKNIPFLDVVDLETHTYLPPRELSKKFAAINCRNDASVVTYCHAGNAASSVAFAALLAGNERVSIYDGSLREWSADPALPLETA